MNKEIWSKAVSEIDSKYTGRAAKSFRADEGRIVVVKPVVIYPPQDIKPKGKLRKIITAAASVAAAGTLIAGGVFVVDRVKSVPASEKHIAAASGEIGASDSAAETTVVHAPSPQDEQEKPYMFFNIDFDIEAFTYAEIKGPDGFGTDTRELSSGCTGAGNFFVSDSESNSLVCRITTDGTMTYYAPQINDTDESERYRSEFYFTENGPMATVRVYSDEVGLEEAFIVSYDDDMTISGVSQISLPDSFLGNTYITYDGKYLIDNHYSVSLNSLPYVRIYEIGDTEIKLLREIKQIGALKYPEGDGEIFAENVIACNISKDGKTLIILAETETGKTFKVTFTPIDMETGATVSAEKLEFDARYVKYDLYYGGIAVFAPGIAEMLTENGTEHYVFADNKLDAENTEYAVSPDGRFIQTLTVDETGMSCQCYTYDTEKAIDENYAKWLEMKDAKYQNMYSDEAKFYGIVSGVNNSGDEFTMCRNGESSVGRDIETQDPFNEAYPMFKTATERENCLEYTSKYSVLAEKLIDGEFVVTTGFEYISSAENGHKGIDIAPAYGANAAVHAYADGTVTFADWGSQENGLNGYGKCVIVDHGSGAETVYAHCSELYVSEGDTVKEGDVIASAGATGLATGIILHFELRQDGECIDPTTVIEEKAEAVVSKESITAWYDSQRDETAPVVYGKEWVKQYEPFGITLDENGYMIYDGEKVRYFLDGITTANGSHTFVYCYDDPNGTIDVRAERELEYDSDGTRIGFGKILLVEKSSEEQFNAKEVSFNIWDGSAVKIEN